MYTAPNLCCISTCPMSEAGATYPAATEAGIPQRITFLNDGSVVDVRLDIHGVQAPFLTKSKQASEQQSCRKLISRCRDRGRCLKLPATSKLKPTVNCDSFPIVGWYSCPAAASQSACRGRDCDDIIAGDSFAIWLSNPSRRDDGWPIK